MAARTTPQAVIDSMARAITQEPGQDEAALNRLQSNLQGELVTLASRPHWAMKELLEVVDDKSKDWRLRRFSAIPLGQSSSDKIIQPLTTILLDKNERPEVRGGAAMGLLTAASKNQKARDALHRVAKEPGIPRRLLDDVMFVIGNTGTDDIDLMLKIADMPAGNLKAQVTNFQAIRAIALRAWHDDKAMEILVKFMVEAPSGSMLRQIALDELLMIAEHKPERIKSWAGQLVEPLIKMTYTEKYGTGNLRVVIQMLGKTGDKRAVDRLIEIMQTHHSRVIVTRSAYALGEIGDPRALTAVQQLWDSLPQHVQLKSSWEFTAKNCPWIIQEKFVDEHCPGDQGVQRIRWPLEQLRAADKRKK